jgi:hypothetical protein
MNLETILSDTYYILIHKLTTIEYHNINIMNWHRTLVSSSRPISESANRDLPSCDLSQGSASTPRSAHVGFVMYKVVPGEVFLRAVLMSPLSILMYLGDGQRVYR